MQGYLEEDLAALRKLRDESECNELQEAWADEDPREWKCDLGGEQQPCVEVDDDRVVGLGLSFSTLAVLPDAIGELDALKQVAFIECTSLAELPAAIGELQALTELYLRECSSLEALPATIGELGALTTLDFCECSSLKRDCTLCIFLDLEIWF